MVITRYLLPRNNDKLPLPFFGGNYTIFPLDNVCSWLYMYINWFIWILFIHDCICYTIQSNLGRYIITLIKTLYYLIILQCNDSDYLLVTDKQQRSKSQHWRRAQGASQLTWERDAMGNIFDITLLSKPSAIKQQNILLLKNRN